MSSKVELRSSDGHMFEVDEAVTFESQTVKNMIEDTGKDSVVPLPNYHVDLHKSGDEKAIPEEDVKAWDANFVKVDQATLLLDLTCQIVADMIK
ncbi:hypothetical protein O6H91_Y333100 [Diphasiastrum complanatum]|nr:hypothetical protein O6H91_Y333100 [Diphasiastrum complanatum]